MGNNNALLDLPNDNIQLKPKGCCQKLSLYVNHGNTDHSDITCSICFRIFANPRVMKCKHKYCEQCIGTWGKGSTASCPFCRIELKRLRGTFGRVDKKTQKKIEKLSLKCRNCCWEGSYYMFLTTFALQPFLDDDQLPSDDNKCDNNDSCNDHIKQEKEEGTILQRTATKQQEQREKQQQKEQELKKQDKLVQDKQAPKAFELFLSTLYGLARSGNLEFDQLG